MSSATTTCVWVQSQVIAKALGEVAPAPAGGSKKKQQQLDLERTGGEWPWTRCMVISGEISTSAGTTIGNLSVEINDPESKHDGKTVDLKGTSSGSLPAGSIVNANEWEYLEQAGVPPDDLITLTHLHEPAVVYCLKKRYEADQIYTSTGPILIALNPFKPLPGLYNDDNMSKYWAAGEGVEELTLKPHVFGHADKAFRDMMSGIERKIGNAAADQVISDQSVLVSGESGAGKTVTAKHIMGYLASLSQRKAEHFKRRRAPSPGRGEGTAPRRSKMTRQMSRAMSWKAGAQIEEKILESNPILEAFGNARTVRNDNSSRFGKFIELQFKQSGSLIGAAIETYLLEKVRLVHPNPGERNFHIFYEMLAAATSEERNDYFLGSYTVEDFKMTSISGTFDRRDGVSDSTLFDQLVLAMGTLGFDHKTQESIFGATMAFLHASNLTFVAVTDDSSKVDETNPHLQPVLKLLGLEKDDFEKAMCQHEIEAGNQSYARQVDKENAEFGLEALVKATYGSMFNFIVQTINKKIDYQYKPKRNELRATGKAAYIGVLDIFGFESFKHNSFEQLCINYCNEALQQQFNMFIFKSEQEEYKREKIAWDFIEFPDNQDVIDLIDKKGVGIIPLLTDQCRGAQGSDKKFADAMYKHCTPQKRFEASHLQMGKMQFVIHHFAGPVQYEVDGFVDKNKDHLPRGSAGLLEHSRNEFVQLLGRISNPADTTPPRPGRSRKARVRPTVGGQFAAQLGQLRKRIEQTSPHYIRCLKPNQSLKPSEFENGIIADQLRYAGVLEAIRVSRVGFSQRYSHEGFVDRYRFIAAEEIRKSDNPTDILVNVIAKKIFDAENPNAAPPSDLLAAAGIQKGETKVFLRQHAFDYMERFRTQQLSKSAVKMQGLARRYLTRCWYLAMIKKIVIVQSCIRRFLARKFLRFVRERTAATKIQKTVRYTTVRHVFLQKKAVAIWFQRMHRGNMGRTRYQQLYEKNQTEMAIAKKQYDAAVVLQCMARGVQAKAVVASKRVSNQSEISFYGDSEAVKILKRQRQTAALQADKNAAIAKQTARERNLEVEGLRQQLQKAEITSEQQKTTREELISLRTENDDLKASLATALAQVAELSEKLATSDAENKSLKHQIKSGLAIAPYTSNVYDDYPDLRALDERLNSLSMRGQQSKKELDALMVSLAILK